jgi:hypothetical protein
LPGCAKSIAHLAFGEKIGLDGEIAGICGKNDLAKKPYHNRAALCLDSFWNRFGAPETRGVLAHGFVRQLAVGCRVQSDPVASILFAEWLLTGWRRLARARKESGIEALSVKLYPAFMVDRKRSLWNSWSIRIILAKRN